METIYGALVLGVGHLVMFNVTGSGRGMNYANFLRNVALSTDSRVVVL
jgi:hypothetical protein